VTHDERVGTTLGGYRIDARIGEGGMGVVYRAEQLALSRPVALKLIARQYANDGAFRERFERESRLAASIDHPNVVPVYEAGDVEGLLFIAMRYVEGTDLRELVASEGRLAPPRAADMMRQVGAALDAAHARGLVHRDVKPANVLVTGRREEEHAYLTDFGLTKRASSQSGATRTGEWVGTLDYVAPEQIEGRPIDARTDIYALGCVLHQLLTGEVPYVRDSDVAKMYAHLNAPPPAMTPGVPGLSPAFDAVVERAMAKRPDERYPSAGDLGRAALAAAAGAALAAPERSVARGAASPDGPGVAADATKLSAGQQRTSAGPPRDGPGQPRTAAVPRRAAAGPPRDGPPSAATAVLAPGRRRRRAALAAGAVLLVLAGGAAALAAGGAFGGDEPEGRAGGPETVERRAAEETQADEPVTDGDEPENPRSAPDAQAFEGVAYSAAYPDGWQITQSEQLETSPRERTTFSGPDGGEVSIDRIPGDRTSPRANAERNEASASGEPGYERISFEDVALQGGSGFEWIFTSSSSSKVVYYLTSGGDGHAVLGSGGNFDAALDAARLVAETIEPK